jgi:DNA-binding LacI/PurR family transcriptional regulator
MRDVAKAAGVSVSTVSLALSGEGRLADATRRHVLDVAERMHYRVNHAARSLRRGRSGILVVSVSLPPSLLEALPSLEYYVTICQAATLHAAQRGYALLMAPFGTDPRSLSALPLEGGIVLDPGPEDPLLAQLAAQRVPVVTIGRDVAAGSGSSWWVDSDLPALVSEMLDHLAQRGAERVALLSSELRRSYISDTERAYEQWVRARGGRPRIVRAPATMTEHDAYHAAGRLLRGRSRPDAIYTPVDRFAVAALNAALRRGLNVPGELLIASGNDTTLTRAATIPISSLALPAAELGQVATELLLDRVREHAAPATRVVAGELRVRRSTGTRIRAPRRRATG